MGQDSHIPKELPFADGDQAVLIMQEVGDMIIHLIAESRGRFDEVRLRRALRLLADAQPVVGCRVVRGRWWHRWVRRDDLDELEWCRVVEVSEEDKEKVLKETMVVPMSPYETPMVEAIILRGETDTLCLRISHVIADAGGTKELAYELTSLYRELAIHDSPEIRPNLEGSREVKQLLEHFSWRDRLRIWKRILKDLWYRGLPSGQWRMPLRRTEDHRKTYLFCRLDEEQFAQVKSKSRALGVTFNDLWMAAHMQALDRFLPKKKRWQHRFMGTADLRRYIPGGRGGAVCNLSGFFYVNLQSELGKTSNETAQMLSQQMAQIKKEMIGLADILPMTRLLPWLPAPFSEWFFRSIFRKVATLVPPAYTNMGQVDDTLFYFDDVSLKNVFTTASATFPPFFVTGVTGYGQRMTLSVGYCVDSLPQKEAERYLEMVVEELLT